MYNTTVNHDNLVLYFNYDDDDNDDCKRVF